MNPSNIPYFLIVQIYEFVKTRPDLIDKTNQLKIIDFLRELHEGALCEFKFIEPRTVIGNFGRVSSITIKYPPDFLDKVSFLEWLDRQLNI